ncbi:MAG: alpha-amylase family glycosyl hydrolase [Phycisphaerales bacterium]
MRLTALFPILLASTAFAQATTNPAGPATTAPSKPPASSVAAPTGWWNDAVFYEVFVRSFADSTTGPLANDGIGDFQGLIDKLDYIKSLGVTALWLMPVTQSPSYHGYDTTDYMTIESDYGTNEDFKRFVDECHKRNIKVVIDFVINHCSSKHPWFQAAKDPASDKHDWFIWSDTKPTWKGAWNQTVWHPNPDKSQKNFYFGMFNHDMPDLNFRNPQVTTEIKGTARFWLTQMNVDGFRLDAIRHLIEDGKVQENTPETHAWLKDFQAYCKSVKPDCFTVGEVWSDTRTIASYVNGAEMDSAFEFELESKLVESVKTGKAAPILKALNASWLAFPPGARARSSPTTTSLASSRCSRATPSRRAPPPRSSSPCPASPSSITAKRSAWSATSPTPGSAPPCSGPPTPPPPAFPPPSRGRPPTPTRPRSTSSPSSKLKTLSSTSTSASPRSTTTAPPSAPAACKSSISRPLMSSPSPASKTRRSSSSSSIWGAPPRAKPPSTPSPASAASIPPPTSSTAAKRQTGERTPSSRAMPGSPEWAAALATRPKPADPLASPPSLGGCNRTAVPSFYYK